MFRLLPLLLVGLLFTTFACSTSEPVTSGKKSQAESKYPEWFNANGFEEDSVSYHGFATAISSDSAQSVSNARLKARTNLEQIVSEEMESVRQELEKDGSSIVSSPDFLIVLSNAIDEIDKNAGITENHVKKEENHYRSFVQARITKTGLKALLESGFEGKESYWNELSGSAAFTDQME